MKTVLIVDDEYAIGEVLQEFLEEENFAVVTAANGEQALQQVDRQRPDLVLMDVMMPILDGVETLRRIRQMEGLKSLPVVLMSAVPKDVFDSAVEPMASAVLKKPLKLELLLDTVRRLTGGGN